MAKSNPLFIDSTVLQGHKIATLIELNGILIYDSEAVVALVTDRRGQMTRVPLTAKADGSFEGKALLGHQEKITCRFLVEKEGRELFHSGEFKAQANYAISQWWEPALFEEPFEIRKTPDAPIKNEATLASEHLSRAEELIEKWDL